MIVRMTVYYSNIKIMKISINDKWKYGAIPGLLIHSCLGTVYCWSLITKPVEDCMGISCEWAFSMAIFFLGLSAAFFGPIVEKNVKLASLISAICFGSGMIISGIACTTANPILFHIGYGVIMGIGLGIGYISPIKTLMQWFNNNKGLAAGLAIAGFGLAKVLGGPGFSYFIRHFGVTEMFVFHGILYLLLMLLAVAFIKKPDNIEEPKISLIDWFTDIVNTVKLDRLWVYWLIFYLNISAGLAIISNETVFFNYSGITAFGIGFAVSLCAIMNTLGRLGFAWFSDILNNRSTLFGIITIISVICCMIGFTSPEAVSWVVLVCNAGYGAMFAIMPGVLSDKYGMNNVSKAHGVVLSAWAVAGLTGNQLASIAMWLPISYSPRVIIFSALILYIIAVYLSTKVWKN